MANYRPVHVKIWSDPKFQELEPKSKLVFLYLFTNEKVTESGVYPCTFRTISNETNIPVTEIEEIILTDLKCMISYDTENCIIWVRNLESGQILMDLWQLNRDCLLVLLKIIFQKL